MRNTPVQRSFCWSIVLLGLVSLVLGSCTTDRALLALGRHYQQYQDMHSLEQVVSRLPTPVGKRYVRRILGTPIDFGFDYRYLVDSIGPNGCAVGVVFHIDENGKIGDRWIGEICE